MTDVNQIARWRDVAASLRIDIDAPCEIHLSDGTTLIATAHIKGFGAKRGMIADPVWASLAPHTRALIADGYGYSCVEITSAWDRAALLNMLADWGWSSDDPAPPWLPPLRPPN